MKTQTSKEKHHKKIALSPDTSILSLRQVVYEIKNEITNDCYVGYTMGKLKVRYTSHNGCHSSSKYSNHKNRTSLYDDFKKYGKQNFTMSVLSVSDNAAGLRKIEKMYQSIGKYKRYNSRSINRDTRAGKNKNKIIMLIDPKGSKTFFKKPIDVAREFNVHRSSILKAINNGYRFKRKYQAVFVDKDYGIIN